jgi:hypothetical protein
VIAQLVEQWTENPCVAGSTPARTTKSGKIDVKVSFPVSIYGKIYFSCLAPDRLKMRRLLSGKIPFDGIKNQTILILFSWLNAVNDKKTHR